MKYVIGDVARTLGLTTAGLHYFEREGVIDPKKGDSTRRYYCTEDLIRLISYKKYRAMEMPLKEIVHQFSAAGETSEGIRQKMAFQQDEMLKLARKYERLAQDINWYKEGIARVENTNGEVDIQVMPSSLMLCVGRDGLISRSKEEQNIVAGWLENVPATRLSVFRHENGQTCFGYSLSLERAQELCLMNTPGAAVLPGAVALHVCRKLSRSYFEDPQIGFQPLLEEMAKRGFQQAGTGIGVHFCVECSGGKREILCELWLPIK